MHLARFSSDTLVPQVGDRSHECTYDLLLPQNAVPALHVDVGSLLRFVQRSLVLRRGGVSELLQISSGAVWRVWWGYPLGFGVVAANGDFACFLPTCATNGPCKYQLRVLLRTGARIDFTVAASHAHVPINVYVHPP